MVLQEQATEYEPENSAKTRGVPRPEGQNCNPVAAGVLRYFFYLKLYWSYFPREPNGGDGGGAGRGGGRGRVASSLPTEERQSLGASGGLIPAAARQGGREARPWRPAPDGGAPTAGR
jgi:hypothetical protein